MRVECAVAIRFALTTTRTCLARVAVRKAQKRLSTMALLFPIFAVNATISGRRKLLNPKAIVWVENCC